MLEARISLLLGWEKRKRREATLTVALFYAFLAALAVPLFVSLPPGWAWAAPAAIFAVLMPCLFFTRRWRERDTARALAALDKSLRMDERATTAWELLRRNETKAVALLVLSQANEMLKSFDARRLFPRSWGWHAWLLLPLLALWGAMLHFDMRFEAEGAAQRPSPSLARELRELARELQRKAQSEGLPKTLAAARDLEKIAQRAIEARTADDALKSELTAAGRKMAEERRGSGEAPFGAGASGRELGDLRAELEAARESFPPGDGEAQSLQERLAGLSQLKKQLDARQDARQDGARELSRDELKSLLDKLEQDVTEEQDRRALAETEQSLKALAQGDRDRQRDARAGAGPGEKREGLAERRHENMPGSAPGDAPGKKSGTPSAPTEYRGDRRAQVKGVIGEGERGVTFFKAKPAPGKSGLAQDEVISSYRRQAESELHTEKIPEELKDTIKNYFLSLEKAK